MQLNCPRHPAYWEATEDAPAEAAPRRKRRLQVCTCCGEEVAPGSEIFPRESEPLLLWAHTSCALKYALAVGVDHRPGTKCTRRVCKHWARTGRCAYGTQCFFGHPQEALAELAAKRASGERRRAGSRRSGGVKKRVHVANAGRVAEFRR